MKYVEIVTQVAKCKAGGHEIVWSDKAQRWLHTGPVRCSSRQPVRRRVRS